VTVRISVRCLKLPFLERIPRPNRAVLSVAKVSRADDESDNVLFDRGTFHSSPWRRLIPRRANNSYR
jgi:hypothetical protein